MFGMRSDPSMIESPHISVPMKGDITKIDPLVSTTDDNAVSGEIDAGQGEMESRELGSSPPENTAAEFLVKDTGEKSDGAGPGYQYQQSSPGLSHVTSQDQDYAANLVSHRGLPQARQTDTIFRGFQEPQQISAAPAPASWSNVVSANAPPSPLRLARESSGSGETLLTSNISQPAAPTNFHYLGTRTSRSQSFDTEASSPSAPNPLAKSFSFGNSANDTNQHQGGSGLGIPPSHPGHSSYKDSTLPTIKSGIDLKETMAYPSTQYQEFKPRSSSMGSYSPISMGGDSMTTDQTSPMSSPSLSPHVSPSLNSRKYQGDGPPMMWHLSDANEYHSEPSSPQYHHYRHPGMPQSIPEHHRHEPRHHGQQYVGHHQQGPHSPPRHGLHPHHGHHSMYSRGNRPGPKLHHTGASSQTSHHHRSSTEVLKTLLRKKACLYEPETSLAVSLATWLVGRRLALSKGYFTRQELQAGVHSTVACKIDVGIVTRTKVNRCMQVVLNSCFHYIIPSLGGEECGLAFRDEFKKEAADEDGLLDTLPPPWDGLRLPSFTERDEHSSLFHDSDDDEGDHSSSGKPRSDSLDSEGRPKRSVLLCFNENVRSASDVFRCHNEFVRDVAHTGNLSLSAEEWRAFFSGSRAYGRKGRGLSTASPSSVVPSGHFSLADVHDRTDPQGLSKLRTSWCAKRYDHDHAFCAFAHVGVNRGWLRRDPTVYSYGPQMCPYIKPLQDSEDCHVNMCPLGARCDKSHSREESAYHPESYRKRPCGYPPGSCPLGDICPNVHDENALQSHYHQSHGYRSGGKQRHHHHDHSTYHGRATQHHLGPKGRHASTASAGRDTSRLPPDGCPMLYVDPSPISEFEKTLQLPGLRAIFRDHSASMFYNSLGEEGLRRYEYSPFGYRPRWHDAKGRQATASPIERKAQS